MSTELVKVVVGVPKRYVNSLCKAVGDAGGGNVDSYCYCSSSVAVVSRFIFCEDALVEDSFKELQETAEERLEFTCNKSSLRAVIAAVRNSHPYEEPFIDVYPLLTDY